jgi:two-component system response regulator
MGRPATSTFKSDPEQTMANPASVILVVEDNPDDAEMTLRALERNRIANEIVLVRNGADALDYLFGTGAYAGRDPLAWPQVVLLDLKLPKVDGLQVLRRIRADERTRQIPVVILTSSDEQRDLIESYDLGANSYVRKPVVFKEFMEAVERIGLYWVVVNKACPQLGR